MTKGNCFRPVFHKIDWETEALGLQKETEKAAFMLGRLRKDFALVFNYLVGSCRQDRTKLFSQVGNRRTSSSIKIVTKQILLGWKMVKH